MKKFLFSFVLLVGIFFSWSSFADQPTGQGTMNTITQFVNSMADNGLIDADVARYRIGYYHDQIFLNGTNLMAVMTGSEDWARTELSNRISKRLYMLKDQWYLTKEKYDTYLKNYASIASTGSIMDIWKKYKDFVSFEKDIQENEISRTQEALYNKFKDRLTELLKARRITQEKYAIWLDKIYTKVYQYKSDPNLMSAEFEEEAARYTEILPCTPCSSDCTSGTQNQDCMKIYLINPDLTKAVQSQYGKSYEKMTLKTLQSTLARTRQLEKKYPEWSKDRLKIQLQVVFLIQEIAKRNTTPTSVKK